MKDFSYITNSHPEYIENLYRDFLKDPASVDPEIKKFFEGFDFAMSNGAALIGTTASPAPTTIAAATNVNADTDWLRELRAYRMILGYRNKAHLIAKTNPIRTRKDRGANIELSFYGFTEKDLDTNLQVGSLIGLGTTTLRNILAHLEKCYASSVGVEFKYISDPKKVDWLTREIETTLLQPLPLEKKKRALEKLNQGVMFEKFLHTKYVGQKRFSLEGGETTIAALDAIISAAADHEVNEVVIGMAHRGRLNVLANIMGKIGRAHV